MTLTVQKLQFQGLNGNQTIFVDPSNISTQMSVSNERLKKNVGKERLSFFKNDIQSARAYKYVPCGTDSCKIPDANHIRVQLSGVDITELKQHWEDTKLNVDSLIAAGVLSGLRAPINLDTLITTHISE